MQDLALIPISPLTLSSLYPVGTSVFAKQDGEQQPILFLAADQTASDESLKRIALSTELKLFIRKEDFSAFQKYLLENFHEWFENEAVPNRNKAAMLAEVVRNVLTTEFARNDTYRIIIASKQLGEQIARFASCYSITGAELCHVLPHDSGNATHTSNVAFYCSLLAHKLGYSGEALTEIVTGALLHDLGKLDIDQRILNKPGKLDEIEFRTIKDHPLTGFRRLNRSNSASQIQLLMAYQHHERLDGKGYPVGIEEDEIHVASRICTVIDVFEAMTSDRPYRSSIPPSQVLKIMADNVDLAFDQEVFRCWTSVMNNRLSN